MPDYALMRDGDVCSIVGTQQPIEEIQLAFPAFEVQDFALLPEDVRKGYLYKNRHR